MKFHVIRQHLGDKMYMPGDTREASEGDVKHLLGKVLSKDEPSKKAEGKPKNKAEGKSPADKAS